MGYKSASTLDIALAPLHATLPLIADQATRPQAARPFTAAFFDLYATFCTGLPEADRVAIERFLTGSAHLIEPALPFLDYNLSDRIEARLASGAQAEDWPIICQLRSTLEALKELYGMHLPMSDLIPDDPELDQALKDHARDRTGGKAPKGFSREHWWWEYA
jgi:hypothetical protein